MILHKDGLIELDYDAGTDILYVNWPDLKKFSMVEIEYSFRLLIENIVSYDIKKLLIDSSKNVVEIENEEYNALMFQLTKNFAKTRLRKIARVVSENADREYQVEQTTSAITSQVHLAISYANFRNKKAAMEWLKSPEGPF